MSEPRKQWCYVKQCPYCKRLIEVIADAGVTRETPEGRFSSPCPHCRVPSDYDAHMLQLLHVR